MDLVEKFKEAKINKNAILIKKYFDIDINWQSILDFVYAQASVDNDAESQKEKALRHGGTSVYGNLTVTPPLWITPQTGKVWEDFEDLKDFIYKLNKDFGFTESFEDCSFYKHWSDRPCTCNCLWHSEGFRISLANRFVSEHSDPWDACYFQIIGKSFWKIKGSEDVEYELNPGDILFFPKSTTHEVWSEGPRVGILLGAIGDRL
jgi:hypothetical protein